MRVWVPDIVLTGSISGSPGHAACQGPLARLLYNDLLLCAFVYMVDSVCNVGYLCKSISLCRRIWESCSAERYYAFDV